MKKVLVAAIILAVLLTTPAIVENAGPALSREDFEKWPYLPEYTVLNPFPLKGNNCTWFAHGRMIQLGYCTRALNSMRFSAHTWAGDAASGAVVSDEPVVHSIAYWDRGMFFNSNLGHVAVVEEVREDGSILVSDSSVSGSAYRTYEIKPEGERWPCAFIIVPEGENRSKQFSPGQKVQTTAHLLYFRLEGSNQSPVLLPEDTIARIADHASNGIYAPRPRSSTAFHHWWYAEADVNGEMKRGWLAESYLEEAPPGSEINTPESDNDQDEPLEEKEKEPEGEEAGGNPDSDVDAEPESDNEQEPEQEDENKQDDEQEPDQPNESETNPNDSESDQGVDENPGDEENEDQDHIRRTGDVYGDGQVNARDVVLTMHHMMRIDVLSEDQFQAADVNKDGVVDIRDVVLMMRYILRLADSFN